MTAAQQPCTPPDPLVDEVRAIRRALSEQFDNDVDRLCDHLQGLEQQHPERLAETRPPSDERSPSHR